jgi:thymidylate synthase
MLVLSAASASELFSVACAAVLRDGAPVAPRGLATREILGVNLCLTEPRRRLVDLPPVRMLNVAFAAAETVWILSGSDERWIHQYNRRLAQYADNGHLAGAYRPRLRRWGGTVDQLDQVRRLLAADPDSRRAVIQLFDPGRDLPGGKDVPCTLGWRFYLRAGRLHMHSTMRSQDLWLGFCYDVFAATVLQELLAGWLRVEVGEYHHHVDSLHLYATDWDSAASVPGSVPPGSAMAPLGVVDWAGLDGLLRRVIGGRQVAEPGWRELAAVMGSYRAWRAGRRDEARLGAQPDEGVLPAALGRWYDRLDSLTARRVTAAAGR